VTSAGEYEIIASVVEARNLMAADRNGSSDPYAQMTVSADVKGKDKTVCVTPVLSRFFVPHCP
jgi:uncharacterized protein YciI